MKIEYEILSNHDLERLTKEVNRLIKIGFMPIGNLISTEIITFDGYYNQHAQLYSQPMLKTPESVKRICEINRHISINLIEDNPSSFGRKKHVERCKICEERL